MKKPPPIVRKPCRVYARPAARSGAGQDHRRDRADAGRARHPVGAGLPFPQYLTTPDLRRKYDVNVLREILLVGMVIAGGMALANLIRLRNRWLNGTALALLAIAVAMGGHRVPVGRLSRQHALYRPRLVHPRPAGLQHVFILIEKIFPLHRAQRCSGRAGRSTFTHFIVNHLLSGSPC